MVCLFRLYGCWSVVKDNLVPGLFLIVVALPTSRLFYSISLFNCVKDFRLQLVCILAKTLTLAGLVGHQITLDIGTYNADVLGFVTIWNQTKEQIWEWRIYLTHVGRYSETILQRKVGATVLRYQTLISTKRKFEVDIT